MRNLLSVGCMSLALLLASCGRAPDAVPPPKIEIAMPKPVQMIPPIPPMPTVQPIAVIPTFPAPPPTLVVPPVPIMPMIPAPPIGEAVVPVTPVLPTVPIVFAPNPFVPTIPIVYGPNPKPPTLPAPPPLQTAVPDREAVGERVPRHMRWEYCEFTWKGDRYRLETPETVIKSNNLEDMMEKVGSKSKQVHSTAILNALGAQGWELVSHNTFLNKNVQWQYWVFKRPESKKAP